MELRAAHNSDDGVHRKRNASLNIPSRGPTVEAFQIVGGMNSPFL